MYFLVNLKIQFYENSDQIESSIMNRMKSLIMSRKDSYIYKISKEIYKGTKITSNPLEKLINLCVEHKINMINDEGWDPWSQLCSTRAPLSTFFFLLWCSSHFSLVFVVSFFFICMAIYRKEPRGVGQFAQVS